VAALEDATRCVELNPNWWKGYLRKGTALLALGRFQPAAAVFSAGLGVRRQLKLLSLDIFFSHSNFFVLYFLVETRQ
jgi:hypothetical protein